MIRNGHVQQGPGHAKLVCGICMLFLGMFLGLVGVLQTSLGYGTNLKVAFRHVGPSLLVLGVLLVICAIGCCVSARREAREAHEHQQREWESIADMTMISFTLAPDGTIQPSIHVGPNPPDSSLPPYSTANVRPTAQYGCTLPSPGESLPPPPPYTSQEHLLTEEGGRQDDRARQIKRSASSLSAAQDRSGGNRAPLPTTGTPQAPPPPYQQTEKPPTSTAT
ncbi:hypothetical protein Bbelb_089630 [Branchiostoma belcheri]|nr:hypothetical protein Bbelb_089630 [Branchiostoma belcheri]